MKGKYKRNHENYLMGYLGYKSGITGMYWIRIGQREEKNFSQFYATDFLCQNLYYKD